MSTLMVVPEILASSAGELTNIGSALTASNAAAVVPTTRILAAGADEVSVAIASLFSVQGKAYQTLAAHAEAFRQQFLQALDAAAATYAGAEAASVSPLEMFQQQLLTAINTPTQLVFGRPLIGDGGQRDHGGAGRWRRRNSVRQWWRRVHQYNRGSGRHQWR
ncbi:hypothetical protein A5640_11640 [Mycobacterium asiaticum]|uniref:PE domain-containing protein n=1 Tax=Mycobacterium asiaticum TaxID=1790 RepID=A0A1A3KLQ0_MYCAS|nr:hypothetical protein A5640_11640 [Mycobacterium asiaticum]